MRSLAVAITVLAVAGIAGATTVVSGVSSQPMAGGTAYDIQLSCDTDWTNGRITVDLSAGSLIDPIAFNSHITGFNDTDTWVDAASPLDASTNVIANTLEGTEVLDWSYYDTTTDGAQTWTAARIILASTGVIRLENYDVDGGGVPDVDEIYIPEPATLSLLGLGVLGVLARRRR